jgi:hypothetical protein
MITEKMDALLIAPAVALSFAVTPILGKALLHVLIAMMDASLDRPNKVQAPSRGSETDVEVDASNAEHRGSIIAPHRARGILG